MQKRSISLATLLLIGAVLSGIPAQTLAGSIATLSCGDVTGDDNVTASDALLVLRAAVGAITLTEEQHDAADVVPNGLITASDALAILRTSVGIPGQLNCAAAASSTAAEFSIQPTSGGGNGSTDATFRSAPSDPNGVHYEFTATAAANSNFTGWNCDGGEVVCLELDPSSTVCTVMSAHTGQLCPRFEIANCPEQPTISCAEVSRADLDYNEKANKLKLRWQKPQEALTQADFGDPVAGSTMVSACIYDDNNDLVADLTADLAGQMCGNRPCWRTSGSNGYRLKDKTGSHAGITSVSYKAGAANKSKADMKGKGLLPAGVAAALADDIRPTLQLITSDAFCLSGQMNRVIRATAGHYKASLR